MNETVRLLLSLSLSASILATLIFFMKPFIKNKLSKSIQYYIWIIVLLRLIMPFSFEGSVMNDIFYKDQTSMAIGSQGEVQPTWNIGDNKNNIVVLSNGEENVTNGPAHRGSDLARYFQGLFNRYTLYIWLIGTMIAFMAHITGYGRFLKYIRRSNKLATDEENRVLATLLKGRKNVRLVRNPFVTTPMLIGILRPCIIIPDTNYNEKQFKNILLHEIMHLKRFDIGVKWLTMIGTSLHWFNPLMYFIKKEINHACELACDEAVIKDFNSAEKQSYGDTLISVVEEHKYPIGVMQATMCEEKKSLKERLIAIMNHNKKSRPIIIFSVLLMVSVLFGALYLGAGVGSGKDTPPKLYIGAENSETKVALTGSYSWSYRGTHIQADSDHPMNFRYNLDNIVSIGTKEQLIISTQRLKSDKNYDFTTEEISVYKGNQLIEIQSAKPSFMNGNLYIQGPSDPGEYVYSLVLNYKDKGTVTYGFGVRVDMLTYDLLDIAKYKTPYVGDNSKVSAITGRLPVPDRYFQQRYTSMKTSEKPYGLTVYYESATDTKYKGVWPIETPGSVIETNSRTNALVVFAMIDNLDEVTFAYRISQSKGELDTTKYDTTFTFLRASFEEKYGDLSVLGENLDLLQDALLGK